MGKEATVSRQERGLGRGLDALFRNQAEPVQHKETGMLPVTLLRSNPHQPRTLFDEDALDDLAQSIKSQGIVQPILVRPIADTSPQAYEIVAGERRWRAAKKAGLGEVPVLVRELSDADVQVVALIENLQREDLNPLEEAKAIEGIQKNLELSQEDLAQRLGKSRSALANALRLLQLPEAMQYSLENGSISAGHARALLSLHENAEIQEQLHLAILDKELSVRDAESAVACYKRSGALPASMAKKTDAAPKTPKASGRGKSASLQQLQSHLREALHPKATISGSDDMGRITVPYESAVQLAKIMAQLGATAEIPNA